MPMYVYLCERCGQELEEIQKFSDPPLTRCECGGVLTRQITGTNFQLKGGGWFSDLYASRRTEK